MAFVVPFSIVLGVGALGSGFLRIAMSDKGARDIRALVTVLVACVLLSASHWWLSSLL